MIFCSSMYCAKFLLQFSFVVLGRFILLVGTYTISRFSHYAQPIKNQRHAIHANDLAEY